jgi:hypothetical protein
MPRIETLVELLLKGFLSVLLMDRADFLADRAIAGQLTHSVLAGSKVSHACGCADGKGVMADDSGVSQLCL